MKVASIFVLVAVSLMSGGYPQVAEAKGAKRTTSSLPKSTDDNCESKINQSNVSEAEGEERLQEKNEALSFCASQYKGERKIDALVKDCRKYVSQSVVSQQAVADCQLAAYSYANAIAALRASSSR